jgi:hypothetical protein
MIKPNKGVRVLFSALLLILTALCAVTVIYAEESDSPRTLNVKDFGAKGDGVTNDTDALNLAFADLRNGDTLIFPEGTYLVCNYGELDILIMSGKNDIQIIMDEKAVIQLDTMEDGTLAPGNRYHLLNVTNCKNLTITGGAIYGDYWTYKGTAHVELGGGLLFIDCRDVLVQNIELAYFRGDGSYLGTNIKLENGMRGKCCNVTFDNCYVHDCFRNGITFGSTDGCVISNTVIHDIHGTAPEAAVDIEAEYSKSSNDNVRIENCHFYNNGILSVAVSGTSNNVSIVNSILEQRVVQGTGSDGLHIKDCTVDFVGSRGKNCVIENTTLRYVGLVGGEVTCKSCEFDGKGWIPYRVLVTKSDCTAVGRFEDCTFRGRGLCALGGCIVFCHTQPAEMEFVNCDFKSCGLLPFLGHLSTTERHGCFFGLGWALWLCILAFFALVYLLIRRSLKKKKRKAGRAAS